MADIYGNNPQWGMAFPALAEHVWLTTSNPASGNISGFLVQSVQCRYNKNVQNIREVGSGTTYVHTGLASGSLSLSGIVGSKPFFSLLGPTGTNYWKVPTTEKEVTDNKSNTIILKTAGQLWTATGCIVTNYSLQMSSQGTGAVMESAEIIFGSLEHTPTDFATGKIINQFDIYGQTNTNGVASFISAHRCTINIAGAGISEAHLYQNIQIQYSQNVQPLRAITSENYLYSKSSAQGQMMIDMLCPTTLDPLVPFRDLLLVNAGTANENPIIIAFDNPDFTIGIIKPVVVSTAVSASADGGYCRLQLSLGFSSLENYNPASNTTPGAKK